MDCIGYGGRYYRRDIETLPAPVYARRGALTYIGRIGPRSDPRSTRAHTPENVFWAPHFEMGTPHLQAESEVASSQSEPHALYKVRRDVTEVSSPFRKSEPARCQSEPITHSK